VKDATLGGLSVAGSAMKSGFGALGSWFGYKSNPPVQDQQSHEESKDEA
jgi:hypothetical protein